MEYRTLAGTGPLVSVLGYGASSLGALTRVAGPADMARNVRWALEETDPGLLADIERVVGPALGRTRPSGRPGNA